MESISQVQQAQLQQPPSSRFPNNKQLHSRKPSEVREISRYDCLESLHMDTGAFLDSLSKLQALITESTPCNPREDVAFIDHIYNRMKITITMTS